MEFPPLVYNTPLVYWTTFKESKSPLCLLTLEGTSLELTPPPPLLVCTSPAWFLVSVQVWYAQAGNHASHYLPLSFAGPKAQPVRGLCKDPRDHPPTMQAQRPLQSQLPRSDYGNQLPLPVPRTLSDDNIIPSETDTNMNSSEVYHKINSVHKACGVFHVTGHV